MMRLALLPFVVLIFTSASSAAQETLTIAPPLRTGISCVPVTCGHLLHYQQVYDAAEFPGPVVIRELLFPAIAPGVIQPSTFTLSLSTTTLPVGALTTEFNANRGSDESVFFSGFLAGLIPAGDFAVVGTTPFRYDPSQGNLLLDVVVRPHYLQPVSGTTTFDLRQGDGRISSAILVQFFTGQFSTVAAEGIVTRFVITAAWSFTGFFSPIHNQPSVNIVKAGSAVPVKFSLGGDRALDVFAPAFPASSPFACDTLVPSTTLQEAVSPGGSGLTYDAALDQYTYLWKTEKNWAGSCRRLTIVFKDGSSKAADFDFAKQGGQ